MGLLKSKSKPVTTRKSSPKKKKVELKNAYILPQQTGDIMRNTLAELPIRYNHLIVPMLQALDKAIRGDITAEVDVPENGPDSLKTRRLDNGEPVGKQAPPEELPKDAKS